MVDETLTYEGESNKINSIDFFLFFSFIQCIQRFFNNFLLQQLDLHSNDESIASRVSGFVSFCEIMETMSSKIQLSQIINFLQKLILF